MTKKKIAVIDLLLSYPPSGGAGVDLFNTFSRLGNSFEIMIFGITFEDLPEGAPQDFRRGIIEKNPPVDSKLITLPSKSDRNLIIDKILQEVREWKPDLVYIADGWTLKPYLADRISEEFKTVLRLYAYEMLCPRNNQKWLFDHGCKNNALIDCQKCLACCKEYSETVHRHRNGQDNPLTFEATLAGIWNGDYERVLNKILHKCNFIVYNEATKNLLSSKGVLSVTKIPGAVDITEFNPPEHKKAGIFTILVYGRMNDRAKGADTAIEAGKILAAKNIPFKMIITSAPKHDYEWLEETGWTDQKNVIKLLEKSDCAFVPSLWEEAFGMTWVEASAMGVPVVASRIGGPAEYIEDGKTGLLAEPGNPDDFAEKAIQLYNNISLREYISQNARKSVWENFTWDICAKKTERLIESIISENADQGSPRRG